MIFNISGDRVKTQDFTSYQRSIEEYLLAKRGSIRCGVLVAFTGAIVQYRLSHRCE